jgi:ABC-2 type transport system permease protein
MVPRYIMSEGMRRWGQLTFNAWALDGFKKVFWYDASVAALRLEVSVLLVIAILLAFMARLVASRWATD